MNLQHGPSLQLNLHANEVEILQSFVRTRIDVLEFKAHIIHVLKRVCKKLRDKINPRLLSKQKTEKIAPPFYSPARFKAQLNALTLILCSALFEWILDVNIARLAQLDKRRSAEREAAGSNPGRTNPVWWSISHGGKDCYGPAVIGVMLLRWPCQQLANLIK